MSALCHLLFPSRPEESVADCAMSAGARFPCCSVRLFFFFFPPIGDLSFMLTGWLDSWTDCRGKSDWQNVFIPLPPQRITGERLCSPKTYGPMLVPGLVQKGLEPAGWSVSMSAVAPRCISKPLHRQASNGAQTSTYELTQSCAPQWPLSLLVWSWENHLSLRAVTFN